MSDLMGELVRDFYASLVELACFSTREDRKVKPFLTGAACYRAAV